MTHSHSPIIQVIGENYLIPQLGRTRRIAALLPSNYYQTNKHYPVLYLHDGQNLFNEYAPYGNWAIDKSLALLAKDGYGDVIVIAIDHGGEQRINEFMPYDSPKFGKGNGRLYLQFLVETLKPLVDRSFRVINDRQYTGIGGSSMGGLISLFGGLTLPDVFGKLMIFSPSLWTSPQIYDQANIFSPVVPTDIYLYAGAKESRVHLPNVMRLKETLEGKLMGGGVRLHLSVNKHGTHNEAVWGAEFPKAIKWLYFDHK